MTQVGDILHPLQFWNDTEGNPKRHLSHDATVLGVREEEVCETGTMVQVEMASGMPVWLDRNWFEK